MKEKLYRDEMVEKLSTPESLNEYMKVIRFHVWPIITVFLLVVSSAYLWISARNDLLYIKSAAEVKGGVLTCYVKEEYYNDIINNIDEITVGILADNELEDVCDNGIVISETPDELQEGEINPYVMHIADLYYYEWMYEIKCSVDIDDGVYPVVIYRQNHSLFDRRSDNED